MGRGQGETGRRGEGRREQDGGIDKEMGGKKGDLWRRKSRQVAGDEGAGGCWTTDDAQESKLCRSRATQGSGTE